jgi:hypothetical protein
VADSLNETNRVWMALQRRADRAPETLTLTPHEYVLAYLTLSHTLNGVA